MTVPSFLLSASRRLEGFRGARQLHAMAVLVAVFWMAGAMPALAAQDQRPDDDAQDASSTSSLPEPPPAERAPDLVPEDKGDMGDEDAALQKIQPAAPPAASQLSPLDKARALERDLRPQEALEVVDAFLAEGGRTRSQTLQAWGLRGQLLAQLDEGAEAERSFQVVLRIQSEWTLPPQAHASALDPFRAATATWPGVDEGFAAQAQLRTVGSQVGIEVALVADDLQRIRACGLVGTETLFPLDHNHPIAFIPLTEEQAKTTPLKVAVVDAASNTWAVRVVEIEANAPVRWLTVAGAATTFVGLFAASAFAISYTAVAASDDAAATALLAGVGAATAVAAVGAGLVVADEVFLTEGD